MSTNREQLNHDLASILQPIVEIPAHLQANQMILDYVDAKTSGVTSSSGVSLTNYYTKNQVDVLVSSVSGVSPTNYYTKTQVDTLVASASGTSQNLVVNAIADLRSAHVSGKTISSVLGYTSKGDGGAANFYWDSASTETDDGVFVIKPTAITTGRWKKILSGAVRLKECGVKTDGSNQASLLNTLFSNASVKEVVHDGDAIAIASGSTVNAQGKKIIFSNGARVVGAGTLDNALIDCHPLDKVFGAAVNVTNIVNSEVSIRWFSGVADYNYNQTGGTDNYPAFWKAVNSFGAYRIPTIYFPKPSVSYFDDNLGYFYNFFTNIGLVNRKVHIYGDGRESVLKMDGAQLGIGLQGDGSTIKYLTIRGAAGTNSYGYNSDTAHGLWINSNSTIAEEVYVQNFDGDGIFLAGDVNGGTNANLAKAINCKAYGNGRANIHTKGGDGNAQLLQGFDVQGGGRFGLWAQDFLGNTFIGSHSAANCNGNANNKTIVTHNGANWWAMQDNIGVEPGTNASVWQQVSFGNLYNYTWDNATQYYFGCGYFLDGANQQGVVLGCYSEGDEMNMINSSNSIVLGGFAAGYGSVTGSIANRLGHITSPSFQAMKFVTNNPFVRLDGHQSIPALAFGNNATFPMGFWQEVNGTVGTMWADLGGSYTQYWASPEYAAWPGVTGRDRHIQGFNVEYVASTGIYLGKTASTNFARLLSYADAIPTSGDYGIGDTLIPTNPESDIAYWRCTTASTNGTGATWSAVYASQWTNAASGITYNTGNVGIGTSSPDSKLHVNGMMKLEGTNTFRMGEIDQRFTGANSSAGVIDFRLNNGNKEMFFVINPSGNATISNLMLYDNGNGVDSGRLVISNNANEARIGFTNNFGGSKSLVFMTNQNTERMYIRNNGNVEIAALRTSSTAPSTTGTTKMVVTDQNGLLSFQDIPTGSTATSRFGFAGEDATANEGRTFDANANSVTISGATQVLFEATNGDSTSSLKVGGNGIVSTTGLGFIPPKMTTDERTGITSPVEGMMVFDTDTKKSYTYDGTTWQPHW